MWETDEKESENVFEENWNACNLEVGYFIIYKLQVGAKMGSR